MLHRVSLVAVTLLLGVTTFGMAAPAAAQSPRPEARDARHDLREARGHLQELRRIRADWNRAIARGDRRLQRWNEDRLILWMRRRVGSARQALRRAQADVRHAESRDLPRERWEVEEARRELETWERALVSLEERVPRRRRRPFVVSSDFLRVEQLALAEVEQGRRQARRAQLDVPRGRHRALPPPTPY